MSQSNNQNQGASIEAELLPCPFCGGAARIESNRDWHRLFCAHDDNCVFDAVDHDLMFPALDRHLADMAEVWNRRSVPPAAGETEDLPLPSDSSEHEQFVAWVDSMQEPARAHLTAWNGWEARARLDSNQSATTDLPPLPRNYGRFNINGPDEHRIRGWTQEQMQQYASEAIAHYLRKQASQDSANNSATGEKNAN